MTELVACLSVGKGTWIPVIKLINSGQFEKTYLIATAFAKEKFLPDPRVEMIVIDPDTKNVKQLEEDIMRGLKGKIAGFEVAVDMTSGTGKEHMALLGALLKLGVGLRLASYSDLSNSIEEL